MLAFDFDSRRADKGEVPVAWSLRIYRDDGWMIELTWGRRKGRPCRTIPTVKFCDMLTGTLSINIPLSEELGELDLLKETADDGVSLEGRGRALNESDHFECESNLRSEFEEKE